MTIKELKEMVDFTTVRVSALEEIIKCDRMSLRNATTWKPAETAEEVRWLEQAVSLKREAELLGANRETFEHPMTAWAEANEARYGEFEELLVELYYDGEITSEQAYQLAGEALYDFYFPFEEGDSAEEGEDNA